ncbi:TolC family protein [Marinilabiliaceae bacterium JC017]|nr:TolC family protein [Marinilabiliaceae bacterium JC017]
MNQLIRGFLFLFLVFIPWQKLFAQRLLTLQQSVSEALEKSPEIRQAKANLIYNRENLTAQRASLKSKFKLSVTPYKYSNSRNYDDFNQAWYNAEKTSSFGTLSVNQPIVWTDGELSLVNRFGWEDNYSSSSVNQPFKGFSNSLDLRLNQPVFTYNRRKLELRELELAFENAQLSYALKELNIEKRVTDYFYQLYQTQMNVLTYREEYANRKKSYDIIKNKVEAGLTAKEELLQAELDLMSSSSTLQNSEVNLENVKDNFKQMLGIPLEEEIMVIAEVSILPVDIDLAQAISYGLKNRMEIRQREIEIEKGQFDIIRTNALNEFKGNVGLSVGLFGNDERFQDIYATPNDNQDVSVSFEIPLWDWGEKKARLRAAEANLQAQEFRLEDEQIGIKLSVRQIHRTLKNLLTQINIARKNEENAKLTYEINLEKYKNGDLTSMDLNLVQNQLTQKKNDLTSALINYKLELLNMKLQTLYDFENKVPVIPEVLNPEKR